MGALPAAGLHFLDTLPNNRLRWFYAQKEYPIVRALACLSLLNVEGNRTYLDAARKHLQWLATNRCSRYDSYCWGLGFHYPVAPDIVYDRHTPLATVTPYALEAFVRFSEATGTNEWPSVFRGVYDFVENDLQVMEEGSDYLVTSYSPSRDRVVINAVSYTMYSYALLLPYLAEQERASASAKIARLYRFLVKSQHADGSWPYSPAGRSFIDCFHSCIVLKNIIKTNRKQRLPGCEDVVGSGYQYLKGNLFDEGEYLFRRFAARPRPSLVKFDLYDNAEMLQVAALLDDHELGDRLASSIMANFVRGNDIYSQIDLFGAKRNRNMLRWAVMPFLYALSVFEAQTD